MCDPLTLIGGALGMMGMFMQMGETTPPPPKPETPAVAAPTGRTPGAAVRLGNGDEDIDNTLSNESTQPTIFQEKRVSGNSLGNLGKSGLAL